MPDTHPLLQLPLNLLLFFLSVLCALVLFQFGVAGILLIVCCGVLGLVAGVLQAGLLRSGGPAFEAAETLAEVRAAFGSGTEGRIATCLMIAALVPPWYLTTRDSEPLFLMGGLGAMMAGRFVPVIRAIRVRDRVVTRS